MKFFLDTANLEDLQRCASWGIFSGVTVNPVLLVKETVDYEAHSRKILKILPPDWEISLEVRSGKAEEMVTQGLILSSWDTRVRLKIPTTVEGLKCASILANEVPLNMTVIKSAAQAMLCQAMAIRLDAKDMVISVFCDRLRQAGQDWHEILRSISQRPWKGKVLAASIKTPTDLAEAITLGAEIVTAPPGVYQMALSSSLVNDDVNAFDDAFDLSGLHLPGKKPLRVVARDGRDTA